MNDDFPRTPTEPELTLEPTMSEDPPRAPEAPAPPSVSAQQYDIESRTQLTPEERARVDKFAEQIDIHDSSIIMQYGSGAQSKMSSFSESALQGIRAKDMGEIGAMLSGLVVELKNFDVAGEKDKGFFGFLKKGSNKIDGMKAKYATTEQNVGKIVSALEQHQITMMKDIAMLDKLYDQNVVYFKELTMYILAGKKKLKDVEETELPALRERANQSGLPEDAQAANDLANLCDRFAKKLHDLELTRSISIQMAPQIRLIQNNDTLMGEKIQSTLVNTIPLWKSQMVLALGVEHSKQAAMAQREVSEMTNELLKKNSETLKLASVETAKESERGIVDIETLQTTNRNLMETLDEVVRIQDEGRQKRTEAEAELARIEGELKEKLLELRK